MGGGSGARRETTGLSAVYIPIRRSGALPVKMQQRPGRYVVTWRHRSGIFLWMSYL